MVLFTTVNTNTIDDDQFCPRCYTNKQRHRMSCQTLLIIVFYDCLVIILKIGLGISRYYTQLAQPHTQYAERLRLCAKLITPLKKTHVTI